MRTPWSNIIVCVLLVAVTVTGMSEMSSVLIFFVGITLGVNLSVVILWVASLLLRRS